MSSPISRPIFSMNRAMLCGSFSSSPSRLPGSARASRRASSDFGETNRDMIRSIRALVQQEQAGGAWWARLNTRTVLRFPQPRQRYSYKGMDHIPMDVRGPVACLAKRRSGTRSLSTVLASVRAKTGPVPDFRRIFAHSCSVVPVVKTSSTRRMRFPVRSCGLRTANAFRRFRSRACRVNVVWGSVAVILTRCVVETGRVRWRPS